MVRLIKLIEQGLQTSLDKSNYPRPLVKDMDVKEKSDSLEESSFLPQKEEENYELFSGEGSYLQRSHQDLYFELVQVVRSLVAQASEGGVIDQASVESILHKIIESFDEDIYSQLLMLTYSSTDDDYLIAHIANTLILVVGFSRFLDVNQADLFSVAKMAMLNDLGMIKYKKLYSLKRRLRKREFSKLQNHPFESVKFVENEITDNEKNIILDVHERECGQGYPTGKTNEDISLLAKVISICDIYESLTHTRTFRAEYIPFEAMKIVIKMSDDLLDEYIVKKFLEYLSVYPIGSLVNLSTGEIGVVIKGNQEDPTKPIVQIIFSPDYIMETSYKIVNLTKSNLIYIQGPLQKHKEKELMALISA